MRDQMTPHKAVENELFYKLRNRPEKRGGVSWVRVTVSAAACVCVFAVAMLALVQPWDRPPQVPTGNAGIPGGYDDPIEQVPVAAEPTEPSPGPMHPFVSYEIPPGVPSDVF
jgi:hypothetical protein